MSEVKMLTAPVPNVLGRTDRQDHRTVHRSGDTVKTQSLEEIR